MKTSRRPQAEQMPLPGDPRKFGDCWSAWWKVLQPDWRGENLSRDIPLDATWAPLLAGGANGVVLVVLSLAWWIRGSTEAGVSDERIAAAIDDVSWSLVHLKIASAAEKAHGKKHQAVEGASKQRAAKRCVIFTRFTLYMLISLRSRK